MDEQDDENSLAAGSILDSEGLSGAWAVGQIDFERAGLDSGGWIGELAGRAVDRRTKALLACSGVVVPRGRGP
jgi:hypothetical protein